MVSVSMAISGLGGGGIPVPGLVFVPHNFCWRWSFSVQNGCVLKIKQCSLSYLVFSSVVQVLDDLDSNCLFKSHFKSTKINSLLTSPMHCDAWSWKKSEYLKSSWNAS